MLLKNEIEIYPDQALPHLNQGPVRAFAAKGRNREPAYALICEKHLVPQLFAAQKYVSVQNPHLPRLLGNGPVNWPGNDQRFVFVYENKLGPSLVQQLQGQPMALGIKPEIALASIVRNLVPVLKDMRDADFIHGNIRVDNLFMGEGKGRDLSKVMLGECLSCPPGFLYSPIYEPIERALADPLGRGVPTFKDDMYSFGATLAVLMRNHDPLAGLSNEEIISAKIEAGSYLALTGKDRFAGAILELLRGLLIDDPRQRWSIDDIILWMDGQRVSAKQGSPVKPKAARPLEFNRHKFLKPQFLALELHKRPSEALQIVDSGELKLWINRSIQDKALEERVDRSAKAAREQGVSGPAYAERVAAFTSIALSPSTPIVYKDLKFTPEALGRMLVSAMAQKRSLNEYVEAIQSPFTSFWVEFYDQEHYDPNDLVGRFETCRAFLKQTAPGYGIERCAYFLCQEAPCLSDKVKNYYVRTPEDLILAFDQMAASNNKPEGFFDRHILAFLSVRDKSVIDPYIPDINSGDKKRALSATVKIFSQLQRRAKLPPLPHLSAWIAGMVTPLIERYHNREYRLKLASDVQKFKDSGDLSKFETLFANYSAQQEDQKQFHDSMQYYQALKKEHGELGERISSDKAFGARGGRKAAAYVSGTISLIAVVGYVLVRYSSGIFNLHG